MRRRTSGLPLMLAALLLPIAVGCQQLGLTPAPIAEGSDPLVVNAERASKISLSVFEAAVNFDHDNLLLMKEKLPSVHEQVQTLRREFPPAYQAVRDATKAYKSSRTKAAADDLNVKLAALQKQEQVARSALAAGQAAKPEG